MTKFKIESGKPIITVETIVNGKGPFNFAVDTGASHTVISNQTAAKLGLNENSQGCCGPATGRQGLGAGGPVAARTTTAESVKVGDVEVNNVEVAIVDLMALSKLWDGVIGYTFMRDFRVIIDYPERQISFEKP